MINRDLTTFNVLGSIKRMENILNQNLGSNCTRLDRIPSNYKMTFRNGTYVNCISLFVDIRGSSALTKSHNKNVLAKIYRAYISEVTALMNSCSLNRHIRIVGDCVMGVFNAYNPRVHIKEIFEVAVELSTLISLLNNNLEKKGYSTISVGIGISYGEALMIKVGHNGSGVNDIAWMGDVVNTASKLCENGNKADNLELMVCTSIYSYLPSEYKVLLFLNQRNSCYHGKIYSQKIVDLYGKVQKREKVWI